MEKGVGKWVQRKMWGMVQKMTKYADKAILLDGKRRNIWICHKLHKDVRGLDTQYTQGIKWWPDDGKQSSKAKSQGGGDLVSELMCANDFAGKRETPEGLQKQRRY